MNTTTAPSRHCPGRRRLRRHRVESGLLAGLLEAGADLGAADLVVGTSAGSAVAGAAARRRSPARRRAPRRAPVPAAGGPLPTTPHRPSTPNSSCS
ncbi:hypothetical protein QJS66_19925 [Kocuria rhizophila]|nr:hypothetical protein QJS66_19925 [Kocuria rhizophila]